MGVVHPGAPRPWLYLICERRTRAPGAGVETVYPSAATYYHEAVYPSAATFDKTILADARENLSPKGSVNARFRWRIIIGSVICGHIYAVCYRIKQRNNASLLPSGTQALTHSLRHRHFLRITPLTKHSKNPSRYLRGSRPLKGTALRAGPRWVLHPS